jgi:AcrR family transcriptional regulator
VTAAAAPEPTRRKQLIGHAADLLREGGPRSLTSVAVAERMGITQSAVYRHVRNMEELSVLAAEVVMAELNRALQVTLFDPEVDWDDTAGMGLVCRHLVAAGVEHRRSFEVVARWRFVDGPLGDGINRVIDESVDLIAALLELRWRTVFGHQGALARRDKRALRAHAQALYDDGSAVVRLAFETDSAPASTVLSLDDLAVTLHHRLVGGWAAFVVDMNARLDLPFPRIDLSRIIVTS